MTENINTIIGKNAHIEGSLEAEGHLRIDGIVKGKIKCNETVTISHDGKVEANIEAKSAIISGEVRGNIIAEERIELQAKSVVTGDIRTKSLVVEQGALFQGACLMKNEQPASMAGQPNK